MMATQSILSKTLPVIIRTPSEASTSNPSTPPTPLEVSLTYAQASPTLTLTLSDFSTRLLLLRATLTPTTYATLRAEQGLTVDLPAFPAHLANLLSLPLHDNRYAAHLVLPPESQPESPATFSIVEHHHYQVAVRFQLPLYHADQPTLLSALVSRHRAATHAQQAAEHARKTDAEAAAVAATSASSNLAAKQAHIAELEAGLEKERMALSRRDAEFAALQAKLAVEEGLRVAAKGATERAEIRAGEADLAKEEVIRLKGELVTIRVEMETMQAEVGETEALRKRAMEGDAACGRVAELERERDAALEQEGVAVGKARRLQAELRIMRGRDRVKFEIIGRQEEMVGTLEREIRKLKDRVAMAEVEKEGLSARVEGMQSKLEENAAVLRSDQQVIAYLNRELNRRDGDDWQRGSSRERERLAEMPRDSAVTSQ